MKKEIFCTELLSDYILSDKLRLLLPNSVNCRIIRKFGKRANQHTICKPRFRKQFFRPLKNWEYFTQLIYCPMIAALLKIVAVLKTFLCLLLGSRIKE